VKLPRRIWPSGAARRLAHREGASLSNAHHHDRAFSGRRINRRANVSSWNKPKPTVQSVFDLTGHSPKGWVETSMLLPSGSEIRPVRPRHEAHPC